VYLVLKCDVSDECFLIIDYDDVVVEDVVEILEGVEGVDDYYYYICESGLF